MKHSEVNCGSFFVDVFDLSFYLL